MHSQRKSVFQQIELRSKVKICNQIVTCLSFCSQNSSLLNAGIHKTSHINVFDGCFHTYLPWRICLVYRSIQNEWGSPDIRPIIFIDSSCIYPDRNVAIKFKISSSYCITVVDHYIVNALTSVEQEFDNTMNLSRIMLL